MFIDCVVDASTVMSYAAQATAASMPIPLYHQQADKVNATLDGERMTEAPYYTAMTSVGHAGTNTPIVPAYPVTAAVSHPDSRVLDETMATTYYQAGYPEPSDYNFNANAFPAVG